MEAAGQLPRTIAGQVVHELTVKRSRFIATLAPIASAEDASAVVAQARRTYWEARHHCTAMILGEVRRSSDDGEPAGTAGMPMLDVLVSHHLTDVVAVVSRIFGGVLLGTGGLVRAYSSAVAEALEQCTILERHPMTQIDLDVDYAQVGRVEHAVREWLDQRGGSIDDVAHGPVVKISVMVHPKDVQAFEDLCSQLSSGQLHPHIGPTHIVIQPPR